MEKLGLLLISPVQKNRQYFKNCCNIVTLATVSHRTLIAYHQIAPIAVQFSPVAHYVPVTDEAVVVAPVNIKQPPSHCSLQSQTSVPLNW